jgi:NAD(P)H-dependent flavin oxidoreductase YrpB (nitropropane dioxygenase family)
MLSTRFTDTYGIAHPIAQAGMAFAGMTPELAIAVCEAGGLGSLGVGLMPPPMLQAAIAGIAAATPHPFNINLITPLTQREQLDVVIAARVNVVSFHWGHPPREWIDELHAAGIKVWEQIGTPDAARSAVEDGIDLIVAQGAEAGGHAGGHLPTMALVPLVVDAVGSSTIVLAAGGIADGRGLAAALALGADGAWIGTRLVASAESSAHDGYKARLVAARAEDTVRTHIFGRETPAFNPMRVLRNRVVAEWDGSVDPLPDPLPVVGHFGPDELRKFTNFVPMRDLTTGDLDEMPLLAGQGVGLIDAVEPAKVIIERLVAEATAALRRI